MKAESKRNLASDFFNGTTQKDLAIKYDVQKYKVRHIIKEIREKVSPNEDYIVIKVAPKWVKGIEHLLQKRGIPFEIPEKFELTEYVKSNL